MADVAILQSRFSDLRLLAVRLDGAIAQTVSFLEWAVSQCPCVATLELGDCSPGSVDATSFDSMLVMASEKDGADARNWHDRYAGGKAKSMLSLTHGPQNPSDFGNGWDAVFHMRSGRYAAPLALFLSERLIEFQDADLFALLSKGDAFVEPADFNNATNANFLSHASAVIVHFSLPDDLGRPWAKFSVEDAAVLADRMRDIADAGCDWLYSMGAHCRAGSPILICRIESRDGEDARRRATEWGIHDAPSQNGYERKIADVDER